MTVRLAGTRRRVAEVSQKCRCGVRYVATFSWHAAQRARCSVAVVRRAGRWKGCAQLAGRRGRTSACAACFDFRTNGRPTRCTQYSNQVYRYMLPDARWHHTHRIIIKATRPTSAHNRPRPSPHPRHNHIAPHHRARCSLHVSFVAAQAAAAVRQHAACRLVCVCSISSYEVRIDDSVSVRWLL